MIAELSTTVKLVILGILVALAAAIAGYVWYEHREVGALTKANAVDTSTIAAQATSVSEAHATVVTQQKSADITVNTLEQAASDTAATTATVNTINTTRQTAEQQIQQAYANIPGVGTGSTKAPVKPAPKVITVGKTTIDTSTMTEAQALSTVRIESMWQTYCQLNPADVNAQTCADNQ
jgi:predicted outer membrane lipoprotein